MNAGEISAAKWSYLINGPLGAKASKPKPNVATLSDQVWTSVLYLEDVFSDIFSGIEADCLTKITVNIGDYMQVKKIKKEGW